MKSSPPFKRPNPVPPPKDGKPETVPTTNPKARVGRLKPNLQYVPMGPLYLLGEVMKVGAIDHAYGPFNWREFPVTQSTYVEAALRHLSAMKEGQFWDGSGKPHAAHVMGCMTVLLDAWINGKLVGDTDDYPAGDATFLSPEGLAALLDQSIDRKMKP